MEFSSTARRPLSTLGSHGRHALTSLLRLVAVLSLVSLLLVALAAALGYRLPLVEITIANALCLVGGVSAAVLAYPRPGQVDVGKVHLAIALRTGVPLFGLLAVQFIHPALIDAGLPIYLLPLYGATLVVETMAMLGVLKRQQAEFSAGSTRA
ncbi:MAG: hypothetical protein K1X74_04970 [Pirellulales bacterium]|nr:hypothetical protein [Pirellulales bacterium]